MTATASYRRYVFPKPTQPGEEVPQWNAFLWEVDRLAKERGVPNTFLQGVKLTSDAEYYEQATIFFRNGQTIIAIADESTDALCRDAWNSDGWKRFLSDAHKAQFLAVANDIMAWQAEQGENEHGPQ